MGNVNDLFLTGVLGMVLLFVLFTVCAVTGLTEALLPSCAVLLFFLFVRTLRIMARRD